MPAAARLTLGFGLLIAVLAAFVPLSEIVKFVERLAHEREEAATLLDRARALVPQDVRVRFVRVALAEAARMAGHLSSRLRVLSVVPETLVQPEPRRPQGVRDGAVHGLPTSPRLRPSAQPAARWCVVESGLPLADSGRRRPPRRLTVDELHEQRGLTKAQLLGYQCRVDPFVALADPVRRGLLRALALGPARVVDLAAAHPISRPAISKHLRLLTQAGLTSVEDRGRERHYALDRAGLAPVSRLLDELLLTPPFTGAALDGLDLEVRRTARERSATHQPDHEQEDTA